jgi:tetratricopeptide (TPR) repeat protein
MSKAKEHLDRGNRFYDQHDLENAIHELRLAVELAPDDSVVHYCLANALDVSGNVEEAIDHYETSIKLNPGDADAVVNYSVTCCRLGLVRKALQLLEKSVRHHKTNALLLRHYYCLCESLEKQGLISQYRMQRIPDATAVLLIAGTSPDVSEAERLMQQGDGYKSSGGIHLCRFCGDCGPLLQSFLSLVFLWQNLQILIEIDFSPNARCVIRNPDHLGRLYLLDLVPEDAGDEDSIRLKRETASAISSCGYIFSPTDPPFFRGYGLFRAAQETNFNNKALLKDALQILNVAVEKNESDVGAHFVMGRCNAELYNTGSAIKCFEKVLELRPDFLIARLCLAAEYTVKGAYEDARKQGREIIRINEMDSIERVEELTLRMAIMLAKWPDNQIFRFKA